MGTLVLTPYKPAPATPGDANQIANGFTAIEASVNAISQAQMAAGNKVTASALSGGPPASPSDGDIWIALAVDANGTVWQFRYNAGSASAFKWEFIGGTEMYVRTANINYTNGANGQVFTNSGLILPRAGDYKLKIEAVFQNNGATSPASHGLTGGVGGAAIFGRTSYAMLENGGNIDTVIWEDFGNSLAATTNLQVAVNGVGQPWVVQQILVTAVPVRVS